MSASPYKLNLAADGANVYLASINWPRVKDAWLGTLYVTGDFGGGTVTANFSPDNGATFAPATDTAGNIFSATENTVVNIEHLGASATLGNEPQLYITLDGATAPNINVTLYTND